jgi:AsmA family protein
MSILRLILFLLLLLLALAAAALGYLHFADLNQYRDRIAATVANATGRDFSLGQLDIEIWPRPMLTADGITLANAPWGSDSQMVQVGHLSASVSPASLLFGPLVVEDFTLADAEVLVESDAAGNSNWNLARGARETGEESGRTDSGSGGMPVTLLNLSITDVVVTRRQAGRDDQQFRLDELLIKPDAADHMALIGSGTVLALPLVLTGQLGEPRETGEPGEGFFTLSGSLGTLDLALKGHWAETESSQGSLVEASIGTDDMAALLESVGMSLPLAGSLLINAKVSLGELGQSANIDARLGEIVSRMTLGRHGAQVTVDGDLVGLDKLGTMLGVAGLPVAPVTFEADLELGRETVQLSTLGVATGQARLSASGTLASGEGSSTLQLQAKGDKLSDLLSTLPALAFDGTAQVALEPGDVAVNPLQLRFGTSDISGNLHLASGDGELIRINLESQRLDLSEFVTVDDGKQAAAEVPEAAQTTEPATVKSAEEFVFVEESLPFAALQNSEMDVSLAVEQFVSPAATLEKLKVLGSLHGGELKADVDFVTPVGARAHSSFLLKTAGNDTKLQAAVNMRDMRLNIASGENAKPEDVPPVSLSLNIVSSGESPRSLAANSSGDVLITVGQGRIDNKLVRRVSGDIFAQLSAALNPFAKQDPFTTFECGVIALDIVDGLATLDPLVLQGEKVTILAKGDLDLKTEKLDIKFNTQPRKGIGVSADMFVTPFVALHGTLAHPMVGANKTGTLLTAATGGLYIVLQGVADRAAGSVDHCLDTLTGYNHPPLKESPW